ncbi:hypothetical protein [Coxiella-like endosymbiont]|nr:hypothetical protein [Coxiella-like endosymbiont]
MIIYPEGTRSKTGEFLPFKKVLPLLNLHSNYYPSFYLH